MRSFSAFLVVLASCGSLVLAAPMPQVLNPNAANDRANDGKNAIENEFKIQEAVALAQAGCAGAVIEGPECEAIDADFQARLAEALGEDPNADDAAAEEDAAADDQAQDNNNNDNQDNNNNNQGNQNNNNQGNNNNRNQGNNRGNNNN